MEESYDSTICNFLFIALSDYTFTFKGLFGLLRAFDFFISAAIY